MKLYLSKYQIKQQLEPMVLRHAVLFIDIYLSITCIYLANSFIQQNVMTYITSLCLVTNKL